jgi:hypothetical protein
VRRTKRELAKNRCGNDFWVLEKQRVLTKSVASGVLSRSRCRSDTRVSSHAENGDRRRSRVIRNV